MLKLELSHGFHDVKSIIIYVKCTESEIEKITDNHSLLVNYISSSQLEKLAKHFCGIRTCKCGSWLRSRFTFLKKKELQKKPGNVA